MSELVPFNLPHLTGRELEYVSQAISFGHLSGDGEFTRRCARLLEHRLGIGRVLLTNSGTAALEMAMLLCDIAPGDEVLLPSFTFVTTATAVVRAGGMPRFVDIHPDTLNLDERLLEEQIGPRTRAIVPVHYFGVACEMDAISGLARAHGLRVVEDAAHSVNAWYGERALGSIGDLGCYSFHETKNYICGEGGALCVNDPELAERAQILRDKGTNRSLFDRGVVDKYTWIDVGSSFAPSELLCAFLLAQLEHLDPLMARRMQLYDRYRELFAPLEKEGLVRLPVVPPGRRHNAHGFFLLLPDAKTRDALMAHLAENDIRSVFHYVPLHSSPMGRRLGVDRPLPVTESAAGRLLRLPMFYDLADEQMLRVVQVTDAFLRRRGARID